tara:strand:- start:8408 stop:9268 length:861 start_codon:yes stop_codon:yes gene_type:complete
MDYMDMDGNDIGSVGLAEGDDISMDSSSEDPVYNELKDAMTRGKFVSRGLGKDRNFKGMIQQHDINAYRINEAMKVSKLAFDMTDKTYLNEYQKIILQRAFMYGVNNIICDYPGRIDLIISKCLMEIEADDDEEEIFIMKVLHDGMLTKGTKGSCRRVKGKYLYEHIANIIPFNEETGRYDGTKMEQLMDGINQVWCENIANYNYNDEYDYICYNGVVYDNEPALSEYLGDVRKVPPHGVGGEGNVGYTWKDWYNFYGPSGHNYLVQWIAQEFQNAKDPSPFPPNF